MSDIKLGTDGDLDLSGSELTLVEDAEAIAQEIRIGLKLFQGEWFLDQRVGMPYIQQILVKNPNLDVLQNLFVQAIESVPGVATVDDCALTLDNETRTLLVTFTATTDDGESVGLAEAFIFPQAL